MTSYFDEINQNRLKSILLMLVFGAIFAGIVYLLAVFFGAFDPGHLEVLNLLEDDFVEVALADLLAGGGIDHGLAGDLVDFLGHLAEEDDGAPHPVRAENLDHPDELRVDLDPVPGVDWPQIVRVALVAGEALSDFGLTGWPKTSGSRGIHIYARIEPRWSFPEVRSAAVALAREIERRAPDDATSRWWKEERHGVFVDYNQNAKDRTVASAYSVRPTADARVSTPLTWDEVPDCDPAAFTIDSVPQRFAALGDLWAGIDAAVGSLDPLLAAAARDAAGGLPDAPWPPHFTRQAGEQPRVQPSKRRSRPAGQDQAPPQPLVRLAAPGTGSGPAGRRKSAMPLIEVARAATRAEAMAGLRRWQDRHPGAAGRLEPADVLVDSMRGRFSTWTRIRLNLRNVPEAQRPPQEALEVDYDPWAGAS